MQNNKERLIGGETTVGTSSDSHIRSKLESIVEEIQGTHGEIVEAQPIGPRLVGNGVLIADAAENNGNVEKNSNNSSKNSGYALSIALRRIEKISSRNS